MLPLQQVITVAKMCFVFYTLNICMTTNIFTVGDWISSSAAIVITMIHGYVGFGEDMFY